MARRAHADRELAARDPQLAALSYVLDDHRLSELLAESVHITRVRYKPATSALVAFRRDGGGPDAYGWAMTMAAEPSLAAKLRHRAYRSARHGGGIRLLCPDPWRRDTVVAAGRIEDDWPLRANLAWFRDHGLGRLGTALTAPDRRRLPRALEVLRYKPERRVVIGVPARVTPMVVKIAEHPCVGPAGPDLRRSLLRQGVAVLPELADQECARHGISAVPVWGEADLSASGNLDAAYRAGEALAALHGLNQEIYHVLAEPGGEIAAQISATRSMVTTILPELAGPAAALTDLLLAAVADRPGRSRPVLIHGDFSADQILVQGSEIRMIDFDRMTRCEAEADLGAFGATEEIAAGGKPGSGLGGPKTAHLIDGYRRAGGSVSIDRVPVWAALRLFLGSVDPFRNRSDTWPADTDWHIRRALELIT